MPNKTKVELQTELPILIKSKGLVSPTKTTGDSLRSMLLDIIDSMGYSGEGVPEGGIIEWYGSIASIPQYWILCDGRYGTPDLRDKFVIGAGSSYAPHDTGGSSIHTHTGTVGEHSLTIEEIPSHSHNLLHNYKYFVEGGRDDSGYDPTNNQYEWEVKTDNAGGDISGNAKGHTHPLNLSSAVTLPPYHALAYIMYKGVNFNLDSLPPSQVINLLVNSITTNSFNVSWDLSTDNIGVIGYDIYLNGSYFDTTSSLSYSFTNLNPSSNYSVIIKARDAEGNVSSDTSTTVTTIALATTTTTTTIPPSIMTSWYAAEGDAPEPESFGPYGFVTYWTNAEHTTQTTKTLSRAREHLGTYNPAPCMSFTHYGIISIDNAVDCETLP